MWNPTGHNYVHKRPHREPSGRGLLRQGKRKLSFGTWRHAVSSHAFQFWRNLSLHRKGVGNRFRSNTGIYRTTRCHIPENHYLDSHRRLLSFIRYVQNNSYKERTRTEQLSPSKNSETEILDSIT